MLFAFYSQDSPSFQPLLVNTITESIPGPSTAELNWNVDETRLNMTEVTISGRPFLSMIVGGNRTCNRNGLRETNKPCKPLLSLLSRVMSDVLGY